MNKAKIVIIGGVAAGASAAARLRRLNEAAEILILERGKYVSYANCGSLTAGARIKRLRLRFAGVDRGLRKRRVERGFDVVCNRWQQCFRRRLHPETPRRDCRQDKHIRSGRYFDNHRKPFDRPRTRGSRGSYRRVRILRRRAPTEEIGWNMREDCAPPFNRFRRAALPLPYRGEHIMAIVSEA